MKLNGIFHTLSGHLCLSYGESNLDLREELQINLYITSQDLLS